jgi:hypothetical protein
MNYRLTPIKIDNLLKCTTVTNFEKNERKVTLTNILSGYAEY